MPLPTQPVSCAFFDQNGNPVSGALVQFKLTANEIYNGIVAPEVVEAVANDQGVVVVNLFPNALGVAGSRYIVRAWNPDNGSRFMSTFCLVPNSPSNLHQILMQEPYPTIDSAQQALISAQASVATANQLVLLADADAQATAADRVKTTLDAAATAADRVQTGIDAADAEAAKLAAENSLFTLVNIAEVAANLDAINLVGDNLEVILDAENQALAAAASAASAAESEEAAEASRIASEAARDISVSSSADASEYAIAALNAQVGAQGQAVIATTQAGISTTQAGLSSVARAASEVARDAAQLSAGIYPSTSAGLTATTLGQYFSVPSVINAEYLILYRHDAGPVATEVKRYPSVAAIDYTVANVIHVKSNGDNTRNGGSWKDAVQTLEKALELAWASSSPTLIEIAPQSILYTRGHLDMPDNCVIKATHRTVFLRPESDLYKTRNVIRMGNGCFVEGLMFEGWEVDDMENPTSGFAISFRPGAVIVRVPYAHKIAVRRIPNWGVVAPPLDRANGNPEVGPGGGVILADGAVCSQYSIFPNIMTWGATPVIPNGIGYCAKNGGLINAVNAVSMWAHKHFMALSGGQIILSSCSTQFGDYSLQAKGGRDILIPGSAGLTPANANVASALVIQTNQTTLINNMWTALVAGGYTTGWTTIAAPGADAVGKTDEDYTRRDAATLLQCLSWSIKTGNEQPMQDFAKGLFNTLGQPVFTPDKLNAFLFAFNNLSNGVQALTGVVNSVDISVAALFAALVSTVTNPVKRKEPSRITAIGHTWTAVMAGVVLTKIPPALNQASISDSIIEEDEGVIIASGQDDQGNALFVGGLEINADTGELGGPPFEQAVRRVATRASIARSF